jgi:hypothetical protein
MEETTEAASSPSDPEKPLEDPRLNNYSVSIALELFLIAIDQCRQALEKFRQGPVLQESKELSTRDRRTLDVAVASFWDDVRSKALRELKRLGLVDEQVQTDDLVYPLAQETALTLEEVVLRKVKDEVLSEHFASFRDDQLKLDYILTSIRLGPKERRESTLGSALLPLVVSKMEEFLGALVRTGLSLYPDALGELPSVPNTIIKRYQANISSSDIQRWQIDQKVATLIKGSPDDWSKTLRQWTKIDITSVGTDWEMVSEMIQRRHAIIHTGGRVDDEYITRVSERLRVGLIPGSILECSPAYMTPVLVELETWAMCLALRWAKHFFKRNAYYYPLLIGRVVELERSGRWSQALAVLNAFLLEPLPTDAERVSLARINRWFCLQQIGRDSESLQREVREWTPEGLEDANDIFRIALGRTAVLRDYSSLIQILRRGHDSEEISFQKKEFREMPLVQRAMQESSTVRVFLQGADRSPVRVVQGSRRRGRSKPRRR